MEAVSLSQAALAEDVNSEDEAIRAYLENEALIDEMDREETMRAYLVNSGRN